MKFVFKIIIIIIFSFYFIVLSIISCNKNSDVINNTIINSNELTELIIVDNNSPSTIHERQKAIINSDCDYYLTTSSSAHGRLSEGDKVIILNYSIVSSNIDGSFKIRVFFQTEDEKIKGYIDEKYITYSHNLKFNIWFMNVLLTRESYYLETEEEIYENNYLTLWKMGYKDDYLIRSMSFFNYQWRIFISERYLCVGIGDMDTVYKLIDINKNENKNENKYEIIIAAYDYEYKITLIDDGESITIVEIVENVPVEFPHNIIERELNERYVPLNREKLMAMREPVLERIQNEINNH